MNGWIYISKAHSCSGKYETLGKVTEIEPQTLKGFVKENNFNFQVAVYTFLYQILFGQNVSKSLNYWVKKRSAH